MGIPYQHEPQVEYGVLETLSPLVRRIVARNPSAFTYYGTGTYVIGHGQVMVVDAGPADPVHVQALVDTLGNERISHLLVTHTHLDHSPGARMLRERLGVPTYGYGPHGEGRYERGATVEAGADMEFDPDERLAHGDVLTGDGFQLEALHTPGHCSNHLCFALREEQAVFTGDHVMGWSTTIVSPPDGDMGDYLRSLEHLIARDDRRLYPTHGPRIEQPQPFLRAYLEHRKAREAQILACLQDGLTHIADMVERMYQDVPRALYPAAARSVLAHLLHLIEGGQVQCAGEPGVETAYRLRGKQP